MRPTGTTGLSARGLPVPELPDLVHVESKLQRALIGRRVAAARTGDPTVLRIMVAEPFPDLLVGRTFTAVERRGHFMCLGWKVTWWWRSTAC